MAADDPAWDAPGKDAARLAVLHVRGPRFGAAAHRAPLVDIPAGARPDLLVVSGDLTEHGLPEEFGRATEWLGTLAESAGVPRSHVAIVPGARDVNRKMCHAHFLQAEAVGRPPVPPHFPKWQPYQEAVTEFFAGVPGVTFTPDEPWTLFELPDLGVVIAGLNSTMALSHQPGDDYGLLTDAQVEWFAGRLAGYQRQGWPRIAVVHHAAPRDAYALQRVLAAPGLVTLMLDGGRVASQGFELIPVALAARRLLSARPSAGPSARHLPPQYLSAQRDAYGAGRDINITNYFGDRAPDRAETFLSRVAEAARLRFPGATITERTLGSSSYLRVSLPKENGAVEVYPVGVTDGPATLEALDSFARQVHRAFAGADPGVRSELVYSGSFAPEALLDHARRRGIRLRSFIEYQGLLDLRPLADQQLQRLDGDPRYPAGMYVEQRFTTVGGIGDPNSEVRNGLLGQAAEWLSADAARLVVVLGDFGRGKTSFLRQLTRRLPAEIPGLTPVLVELRTLEKGPTLDDLLAQHLVRQDVIDVSKDKLRYMIDSGRVALLFDGFDELELRVGYDSAADYLQSLLNSLTGQAKVVLTSRTQHFRSTAQVQAVVRTALGERVETRAGSRVAILEDFTQAQILQFLANLYGGDAGRAQRRFELISGIAGLLDLARNPRMLAFVAELTDERLLAVRAEGGELTAAGLYAQIIDFWLAGEEQRQSHSRGLAALTKDERFVVCTNLALRMWRTNEPSISLRDLTAEVVTTLTRLAERQFSDDQAAHSIASGSLLVRPGDDAFTFIHQSVMEWLVAAHAARAVKETATAEELLARPMSRLMVAFLIDLAGPDVAREWAARRLADPSSSDAARKNALAVIARLPGGRPERENPSGSGLSDIDLTGTDLRGTDLTGRDLRGAILRGADLRGMRLTRVQLDGADLTGADLRGAVLADGSLRRAVVADSKWQYAALLGTQIDQAPGELAPAAIPGHDLADALAGTPLAGARCVAFSPDGALIACGSDIVARICDATTGRTLRFLRGHQGTLTGIAFSPDGTRIATASSDHTARTWDATTGQQLTILTGHEHSVNAVAYSPDGTRIATASDDHTARTWDAATGQPLTTFTGHKDWLSAVAYSPDGTRIATAAGDHTARTWDATTGQQLTTFTGHKESVTAVAYSPDGTRIATAAFDHTARTWDATTSERLTTLTGHKGWVSAVAYSPDGTRIATASSDRTARIWDPATGQQLTILTGHEDSVSAVAYSPDGTHIATTSDDGTASTWEATTGRELTTFTGHKDRVSAVAYSPDGTRIATASDDGTARTWDPATGQQLTTFTGHKRSVTAVAYSPDGTRIATASSDNTARTWDPATGQQLTILTGHEHSVTAVAYSPDGTRIATASSDNTARTWDPATGQQLATLRGHEYGVNAVAYSPDGTRIATAAGDKTAQIWDATTGWHLTTLRGHEYRVNAVAYSPDGTRIATASSDNTARIWDLANLPGVRAALANRLRRRPVVSSIALRGHQGEINDVAFTADGQGVLTASGDGTIRTWRLPGHGTEHVLTGHAAGVSSIALGPDGRFLASASGDGTVRIWSMETAETIATLIPLPEGGYATLLADGSYKLDGNPGDHLWWAMKLVRFAPGELDPYVPRIRRLPADAPILPAP